MEEWQKWQKWGGRETMGAEKDKGWEKRRVEKKKRKRGFKVTPPDFERD